MACRHQRTNRCGIPGVQRRDEVNYPGVFGHDMVGTSARNNVVEGSEIAQLGIAKAGDAELCRRAQTCVTAIGVSAVNESAARPRVNHSDDDIIGYRNVVDGEITAVNMHGAIGHRPRNDQLIHNAARHANPVVLHPFGTAGQFDSGVGRWVAKMKCREHSHGERSR